MDILKAFFIHSEISKNCPHQLSHEFLILVPLYLSSTLYNQMYTSWAVELRDLVKEINQPTFSGTKHFSSTVLPIIEIPLFDCNRNTDL